VYKSILAGVLSLGLLLGPFSYGTVEGYARLPQPRDAPAGQSAPLIPNDQLDSLVAPIALYPDPLLSQVLVASTYPLEIIQLQQWIQRNSGLKGDDLTNAVQKQDWDPSIQAMSVFPDLVKRLADDVKWTTDLGNAFLAQQDDVMDAVQRMRKKAMDAGNLKSSEQQKVETKTVETKTVVVIQPASTQVVYVPVYSPVVVYGPPVYPYPPIYYPPPSYYPAGVFIAFGAGVAYGSYYRGGWGYGCGWGYSRTTININVNNNYISHYNRTNVNINNVNRNGSNNWQHNPNHRGGTPYPSKATATQYGGTARGDSMSTRQANARQQQQGSSARQQPSASNRSTAATNRAGSNTGAGASTMAGAGSNRAGSNAGANTMGTNRSGNAGNNIGNRQIPSGDASRNKSAFAGTSSKASAQASSTRGASSMGASRGGSGSARSGGGTRRL
jgi:Protein of unknown function (DUF3300)